MQVDFSETAQVFLVPSSLVETESSGREFRFLELEDDTSAT